LLCQELDLATLWL